MSALSRRLVALAVTVAVFTVMHYFMRAFAIGLDTWQYYLTLAISIAIVSFAWHLTSSKTDRS